MRIETYPCVGCGESSEFILLTATDLRGWQLYQKGELVEKAFPHWPAAKRELLLTGTHTDCWERIFGKGRE